MPTTYSFGTGDSCKCARLTKELNLGEIFLWYLTPKLGFKDFMRHLQSEQDLSLYYAMIPAIHSLISL